MIWVSHKPCLQLHALQHTSFNARILNTGVREAAVRGVKLIVAENIPHARHLIGTQRYPIWNAPQKGKGVQAGRPLPRCSSGVDIVLAHCTRRRHECVSVEQVAIKEQRERARKVAAQLDYLGTGIVNICINLRDELLMRRWEGCPLHIFRCEVHWAAKRPGPLNMRGVEVWVADHNTKQATDIFDVLNGLLV